MESKDSQGGGESICVQTDLLTHLDTIADNLLEGYADDSYELIALWDFFTELEKAVHINKDQQLTRLAAKDPAVGLVDVLVGRIPNAAHEVITPYDDTMGYSVDRYEFAVDGREARLTRALVPTGYAEGGEVYYSIAWKRR